MSGYAHGKLDKKFEDKYCKDKKKCVLAESLTWSVSLPVEKYTEIKCCSRIKKHKVYKGKEKRKIALNRGDNSKLVWADYVTAL